MHVKPKLTIAFLAAVLATSAFSMGWFFSKNRFTSPPTDVEALESLLFKYTMHDQYDACERSTLETSRKINEISDGFGFGPHPDLEDRTINLADKSPYWRGDATLTVGDTKIPIELWLDFWAIGECKAAIKNHADFKKTPTIGVKWHFPTDKYLSAQDYDDVAPFILRTIGNDLFVTKATFKNIDIGEHVSIVMASLPEKLNSPIYYLPARGDWQKAQITWHPAKMMDFIRRSEEMTDQYNRELANESARDGVPLEHPNVRPFKYVPRPPCAEFLRD